MIEPTTAGSDILLSTTDTTPQLLSTKESPPLPFRRTMDDLSSGKNKKQAKEKEEWVEHHLKTFSTDVFLEKIAPQDSQTGRLKRHKCWYSPTFCFSANANLVPGRVRISSSANVRLVNVGE